MRPSPPPKKKTKQQNTTTSHSEPADAAPKDYPLVPLSNAIKELKEAYDTSEQQNAIQQSKQLFVQRLICVFTFLGFSAAAIYAGITYQQWKEVHRNFEIDQRAWLGLDAGESKSKDINDQSVPRFEVGIRNTGKTPALNVEVKPDTENAFAIAPGGPEGPGSVTVTPVPPGGLMDTTKKGNVQMIGMVPPNQVTHIIHVIPYYRESLAAIRAGGLRIQTFGARQE